jgi:hypothetical protein
VARFTPLVALTIESLLLTERLEYQAARLQQTFSLLAAVAVLMQQVVVLVELPFTVHKVYLQIKA